MIENNPLPPSAIETPEKRGILKRVKLKFKFSPNFLIIVSSLVFVGTILAAYYYGISQKKPVADLPTSTPFVSPVPSISIPTSKPISGQITWLDKPLEISPLDIFTSSKNNPEFSIYHFSDARFYETANLSDGSKLINLFLPTDGMGIYDDLYRFIKSPEGNISFIYDNNQTWEYRKNIFSSSVTLSSFSVRELNPPEGFNLNINNNNVSFKKGYIKEGTFDKILNPKLIEKNEFGDLYVVYNSDKQNPDIRSREFFLVLKDRTFFSYEFVTYFISDDMKVNASLSWSDGNNPTSQFMSKIRSGCGTGFFGPDTIKDGSPLLDSKVQVATYNQSPIFQIKDSNSPILKQLYEGYTSNYREPTDKAILSYNDFINVKNHFIYQDFLGDWLIYINQDYALQAECGKPVIYLYPTTDTQVTVKVAANITQSEPAYPASGWTVLAKPSGQLIYQTKSYPNLFWEGKGHGLYPDKSNSGFLVTQDNLIYTLKSQLKAQGLNSQESADFMDFWTDLLPKDPYVRLTWLNTSEMNILAPLSVSPKPDTTIRLFLEFEGYSAPVNLIPQTLKSIPRRGFTLVEWGGLLIRQ